LFPPTPTHQQLPRNVGFQLLVPIKIKRDIDPLHDPLEFALQSIELLRAIHCRVVHNQTGAPHQPVVAPAWDGFAERPETLHLFARSQSRKIIFNRVD